jgi:hypothetical protein
MNSVDFHILYNTWYCKSFAFAKSYVQDDYMFILHRPSLCKSFKNDKV